ncbi:MAG: DUF58 domain-containing protein [Clostridiales bacterium]|nr:DUF58 domain-containing protein [Clostridiales bacterium]
MTSVFIFPAILLAMALLWLIQGILWNRLWQKKLSVEISFHQTCAVEGDLVSLTEIITNDKFLPLPALHVKFQTRRGLTFLEQGNIRTTDQNYRSDIFSCMPWQQIRRTLNIRCDLRGYYRIDQIQLTGYDLLWSGSFVETCPVSTALYVYPHLIDSAALDLPLRQLTGEYTASRALNPDPFEFRSIRDYAWGDPIRTVNWKATARTGDLKVNVFAPTSSLHTVILLDACGYRLWDDPDLKEEAVRLCATLVDTLTSQGIPTGIQTNGTDCLTGEIPYLEAGAGANHLQAAMELLARLDMTFQDIQGNGSPSMESILSALSEKNSDMDPAYYVLISVNRSDSMYHAFDRLSHCCPGSQWFVLLRPGETSGFASDTIFEWEVPYGKT